MEKERKRGVRGRKQGNPRILASLCLYRKLGTEHGRPSGSRLIPLIHYRL